MSASNELTAVVRPPPPPTPEQFWYARIQWQLFGTLTHEEERLPEAKLLSRFFCVARRAAELTRTHFHDVLCVLRQEDGDKFGHRHHHFVMAGLRAVADVRQLCAKLEDCWQRKGGGRCEIEAYDPRQDGIGYILKNLAHPSTNFPTSAKFTICNGQVMEWSAVHRFLMEAQRKNEPSREHADKSSR